MISLSESFVDWASQPLNSLSELSVDQVTYLGIPRYTPVYPFPGIPGYSWVYLGVPGYTWVYLGIPGYSWVYLGVPGYTWVYVDWTT